MYRLLKRYLKLTPDIVSLTIVSTILVFLCSLAYMLKVFGDVMFLGIPISFVTATLVFPILCFLILWIGAGLAEDIDRRDPRYENE